MDNVLVVSNLEKKYGDLQAINNISFELKPGEILSIVGTSGCGKSSLLNIIAGLDSMTSGSIKLNKDDVKISYMLQNDALLPWLTVYENACLGLELSKMTTLENIRDVESMLKDYGLDSFRDSKPGSLSGGMRQRVALIRSLAIKPDILLLDEPFSALDYYTRICISEDVRRIIKRTGISAIIITHDIHEALTFGDRVLVLSSRPSVVKGVHDVVFSDMDSAKEKRKTKEFTKLHDEIWSELDEEV